jgi:DNA (cytosine-5)-methyltransferase 1
MARPIGIDLFAGAGGLSLGFEQAGFDVVASVEIDPVHAAVHTFNFPHCAVIPRSATDLTGDDIRKSAGLGRKKIDVVFGGAPCQGFSVIGRRAFDDPRNGLVRDFVRLVKELEADYFVFENVKGITQGDHSKFLEELIEAFQEAGYRVQLPWQVLNAAHFGVPQHRERLFLIGAKKRKPLPEYPRANTRPAGSTVAGCLPYGPSCRDALADLPDAEKFVGLLTSDEVRTTQWGKPSQYAEMLRGIWPDPTDFSFPRVWDPAVLTCSPRTDHSDVSRDRFSNTEGGCVEPISRLFRLREDGVSCTLRAGTDAARGAFTSPRPIHYKFERCVTVREMARLHSFPDWFRLHQTKWHGARQVGNAVPPLLGRAVAAQVMAAAGYVPVRPTSAIELGDQSLLTLEVGHAARMFDVPNPIRQRDRKGTPKRRQWSDALMQQASLI